MQQVLMLGIFIFCLLLFFGGRIFFQRSQKLLKGYRKEIDRIKLENKVGDKLANLKEMREEMQKVEGSSRFLAHIAKMAGKLNLKIISISALPAEKRNQYSKLGVTLSINTTYHQLGIFISDLENSDLFIQIDKMSLKQSIVFEKQELKEKS